MNETAEFDPQAFRDFEHAGWERSAANYQDLFGAITVQAIGPMLDAVNIRAGIKLLDVACGPGALTAEAAGRGAAACGLDFSAAMVADARKRNPEIEFRQGDAEDLPFEDGSFDAVVCNCGLLHFPHPDRAIAEAHRVLAPGGRYAFTVWSPPERSTFFQVVMEAIKAHADPNAPLPAGPPMFQLAGAAESKRALESAGFVEPETAEIPSALRCSDPGHVLDVIYKSIVRTRALLEAQTPEAKEKTDAAILEGAKKREKDGEIELTIPAAMAWARKP